MDKLRSLELFIATCDEGSFAGAARICNTDPSTVSKAISRLETQLGLTLFQRSTRQLNITQAGSQYADTVKEMLTRLNHCESALKHLNDSPSGELRISAAVCYGHLYIRPLLHAFCKKYPSISLDLEVTDYHVDIIEQGIDIAIRTGHVKDSRLVARRLSPMDFLTCASPEYLAAHGTPTNREEFINHQWIGFRIKQTNTLQPVYLPDNLGNYALFDLKRSHITDDGETMAYMCADGLGIAQLPHFLAKNGLETGELVSIFPHFRPPQYENGVFAIYPKRDYLPAKVRVFLDFITQALNEINESSNQTWAEHITPLVAIPRHLEIE
ncbi:transcriptional regulator [Pseudoalteromonas sp. A25]|uniref:LysR family transcriptional regulator n=1 Tax=Pseudoalteromonas sp. A25 TaxID=116092 RepID=UPI001261093A|nr:LysR family transcriptional regulator [Pseudoalteromonas sp. A25]BBN81490.1 transcriptional regulator [Pseudoalteromonas sp. A25]